MRRKTLDLLLTLVGAVVTVGLIAASGLLMWGSSFANSQVHNQLAAQKIYFPAANSPELQNPQIKPFLLPYAGKELLTGQEAEVYADHFIAVHLSEIGGGLTYSEIAAKAQADPSNQTLASQQQLMFQGQAIRGELLTAYAFGFFGLIAHTAGRYCFYKDARFRRLTRYRYNNVPWDDGGRYFYIQDGDSVWSPGWKPMRTELDQYRCRHGLSRFPIPVHWPRVSAKASAG